MSWSIGLMLNDLQIPSHLQTELEELASENYHEIDFEKDGNICFDGDAREHQDFLWEEWFQEFALSNQLNGVVIWASVECDNSGEIWGYVFESGKYSKLSMLTSLNILIKRIETDSETSG